MSVLGDLLRYHGVENDELLDALDWKYRRIDDERAQLKAEIEYLRSAHVKACEALGVAEAEIDRLREALESAREFIINAPREPPTARCDECDNGIEPDWLFCAWCAAALAKEAGQ